MDDHDDLLDYYISDDDESQYWARRLGRRVSSKVLVEVDPCLFPQTDTESLVYWYSPAQTGDSDSYSQLQHLSCRLTSLFSAWRERRQTDGPGRVSGLGLQLCLGGEEDRDWIFHLHTEGRVGLI